MECDVIVEIVQKTLAVTLGNCLDPNQAIYNAKKLQGIEISDETPTDGFFLKYNETSEKWEFGTGGFSQWDDLTGAIKYSGGNVGIGDFTELNPPLSALHINKGYGVNSGINFDLAGSTRIIPSDVNELDIFISTSSRWRFSGSTFSSLSSGAYIKWSAGSYTVPTFGIGASGLGFGGVNQLSLIANSLEAMRLTENQISLVANNSISTPHSNGSISFDLDEAGDNLKVRVKYSDGTEKNGTLALI